MLSQAEQNGIGVSCGLLALAVLVAALKNTPFGTRLPHINHLREAEDGDE